MRAGFHGAKSIDQKQRLRAFAGQRLNTILQTRDDLRILSARLVFSEGSCAMLYSSTPEATACAR